MKITILLKSRPSSVKARRALQVTADMMSQGHAVNLYLLQDAVHLIRPNSNDTAFIEFSRLVDEGLKAGFLIQDATLRGMEVESVKPEILRGTYETLLNLMESSDRVIGLL